MPHTRSAKKRLRQNLKRNKRNRAVKHTVKTFVRRVQVAVEANDAELAQQEFRLACKKIDKAAARRIIHPNNAARKKSRLSRLVAPLLAGQTEPSEPA